MTESLMPPSDEPTRDPVRDEVEQMLAEDQTRMGDVYRLDREDKSPAEIAQALGVDSTGFVSNYKAAIPEFRRYTGGTEAYFKARGQVTEPIIPGSNKSYRLLDIQL